MITAFNNWNDKVACKTVYIGGKGESGGPAESGRRRAGPLAPLKAERCSPPAAADNASSASRSRSVTPSTSSYPGTPPERGTSPAAPPRNYSDIMRTLAARYNHAPANEFPPSARPPAGHNGASARAVRGLFAGFAHAAAPHVPAFPLLMDMTCTKTLLAIAKATKSPGRTSQRCGKRAPEPASPLDLSSARGPKRRRASASAPPSPTSAPPSPPHEAACARCADAELAAWSVDDVCKFVESIDICAEYAQNFRDQRIDGSGLPLLTEDHLTGMLQMKLGPALKMKAMLSKKLGGACQHCCPCRNNNSIKCERPSSNSSTPS